ncbi:ABC transporter permease, partial [Pediococcus acidilactici]
QGEVIDSLKNIVKTSYNEILSIAKFAEGSGEKSAFDFAEGSPKLKFTSFAKDDQSKIMTIQILGFMLMMLLYQSGNFGANTIQNE